MIKVYRLGAWVIALLGLFLLCFPKGGIKYNAIPMTWGYLLLLITMMGCMVVRRIVMDKRALYTLMAWLPFQCVGLLTLATQGQEHLGYTCSYILHFFLLPLGFLLVFPCYISAAVKERIFWWVRAGIFFIAVYGLFLFGYKMITGSFLEIPFLTVNYHDMHELEYEKCIDRGGVFKLISTYNNGNLYGVCVLMLLPLYSFLEPRIWKRWLVKTSLILTLSRTIWLGLIAYELLRYVISSQKAFKRSMHVLGSLLALGAGLVILLHYIPFSSEFLLDRFLGNRIGQLEVLEHLEWFSTQPFNGIYEVIYLGVLLSFGIAGLITFLLGMTFPIFCYLLSARHASEEGNAMVFGLVLYLLVACSDGALLLLPVMCFYWLLVMLLITSLRIQETRGYTRKAES